MLSTQPTASYVTLCITPLTSPPPGEMSPKATEGGAFPAPVRAVVWSFTTAAMNNQMTETFSVHSAPSKRGKGGAAGTKGGAGRRHLYWRRRRPPQPSRRQACQTSRPSGASPSTAHAVPLPLQTGGGKIMDGACKARQSCRAATHFPMVCMREIRDGRSTTTKMAGKMVEGDAPEGREV